MFKKYITTFFMSLMLAVAIPSLAGTASAQTGGYGQNVPVYDQNYDYGNDNNYGTSVYDRHRKAINLSVGTGAGAGIGAIFGGKKGALLGAGIGLAGGAIFTAIQHPRNYPRYYQF